MQEIKYPSVVPHLSHDGYHIIKEAIGSSGIKTIYNKSVAHYKFHEPKHSVHFDIGTAVHIAILEPEKFDESVLKCGKSRTTSLYRELKKTKKENQIIITDKEYDICLRSRDSVHSKSECNKVIASDFGQSEMSAFAKDPVTGVKMKTRPDRVIIGEKSDILVDLKTTQSADEDSVIRSISRYGYHIQEAFYRHVWSLATKKSITRFLFLFVEKEPPFACCLYEIPKPFVDEGVACMKKALREYKDAEVNGVYKDYPNEIITLDVPHWAYKETLPPLEAEQTILINKPINLEGDL